VSGFLSQALAPLFQYLQTFYGPTFRFENGMPIEDYKFSTPTVFGLPLIKPIGRIRAPNFRYDHRTEGVKKLHFWKLLAQRFPNVLSMDPRDGEWSKNIHWVKVTVLVPKDRSHRFWENDIYDWDYEAEPPTTHFQFQVEKAGGTLMDAYWRATRLAMEVIQCVRTRTNPVFPSMPPVQRSCSVYNEIGVKLHNLFKDNREPFFRLTDSPGGRQLWPKTIRELDSMIEHASKRNLKCILVLKYYKVHSLCMQFTDTQAFPLVQLGRTEEALRLLKDAREMISECIDSPDYRTKFAQIVDRRLACDEFMYCN